MSDPREAEPPPVEPAEKPPATPNPIDVQNKAAIKVQKVVRGYSQKLEATHQSWKV